MRVGRSVRVSGLVEGVFFRAWTKEQAEKLGVGGWVRNCADGSVEAHLAGDELAVSQLIRHLQEGPAGARVDKMQVEVSAPESLSGFEVRH